MLITERHAKSLSGNGKEVNDDNNNDTDNIISKRRRFSSMVYETPSRHLNVIQLYMKGKAYKTEQRKGPLNDVLEQLIALNKELSATEINAHIKEHISDVYKRALDYSDSKRDRDVVKFLLTKITSMSFAAKLQGVKNRRSIQNCLGKVPIYLDEFHELSKTIMKDVHQYSSLNNRQKKALFRRVCDATKIKEIEHRYQKQVGP